ncbi:glutathione S-transferase 1-1-like [Wyeomyia smithii]|uniref:glutathione S-transferase 1-1-like n=1 Tax=Wyeomyia smithii TaxID=174621 RepID=UPI002467ACBD|nr:glutathione S-transferase 1-1-like [Wyeomyia smithii]
MELYIHSMSPPCWSVLLLGRQLDLKIKSKILNFETEEHLKEDFIKLNPEHTVPTLVDGDFVLSESRAILSYLMDAYAKENHPFYPRDAKTRALIQHRLNFDLGTLYSRFYAYCSPMWNKKVTSTEAQRDKLYDALGFLETYLGRNRYAAGDHLTIADISLVASVSAIDLCFVKLEKYPKVVAWYERCKKELQGYEDVVGSQFEGFRKFLTVPAESGSE